jgi:threonyl-tRNA synthetase
MGLPLWLPKGTALRERLEQFMRRAQVKAGYDPVVTPHIGSKQLYITSGHYEKYGKDSFQPIQTPDENEEFLLKPMNCPHHCEIYKVRPRSYKELPIRYAEFGTVYRYEMSGELHGLTRVRGFTQDDAHIFCRPDQVKDEFKKVIDLVLFVFKALGFENYTAQVSLRDKTNKEKYIGKDELWDKAEREIQEAADEKELKTVAVEGEAAFYGPKLDFMVRDALGRSWQLGTIQVDYNLPERFELEYTGSDNLKHRPVMIHRAPFGSLERFIAVLIEHCAGSFPLWLTTSIEPAGNSRTVPGWIRILAKRSPPRSRISTTAPSAENPRSSCSFCMPPGKARRVPGGQVKSGGKHSGRGVLLAEIRESACGDPRGRALVVAVVEAEFVQLVTKGRQA